MGSLTETKEFDKIKIAKWGLKYNRTNEHTCAKAAAKEELQSLSIQPSTKTIDMININLIFFNSKWLAIKANLKTSSNQVSVVISYKADTDSDGNIMPIHLHKN